jgi:DNA repair exonuclease SbcCD ATPase subunit
MEFVLIIICLVFIGLFIYQVNKNKEDKAKNYEELDRVKEEYHQTLEENEELENRINKLTHDRDMMVIQVNLTAEERNKLQSELEYLRPEYFRLKETISVNAVKSDSREVLEAELENLKALAVEKMSELQQITANTQKLAESQNAKLEEIAKLEAGIKALEGRILSGREVLENLEGEIKSTNDHLCELARLKASVLAIEEGAGVSWVFGSGNKSRLVELIHQLVDEYGNQFPILRKELLKAEWSSVWLPQVQQLCSREGLDRGGIYRLVLRSNPDCVYIGQAQSIKDR